MKTFRQIQEIVERLQYKNWMFELDETFSPVEDEDENDGISRLITLRVSFKDGQESWNSRKWIISRHATDSEIIQTAFKCVLTAEEHETREKFLYDGVAILGPHIDLPSLKEAVKKLDSRH